MSTNLKLRLAKIEANQAPPSIWGDFAHQGGVPTRHTLWSENVDLARWFKTGELPKNVAFFVMVFTEDDLTGVERRLGAANLDEQHPFPTLHPDALKMLQKMMTFTGMRTDFYNFDGHQFRGIGGVLPPAEQRKELTPHG